MEESVVHMRTPKTPAKLRLPRLEEALRALRESTSVRPSRPSQLLPIPADGRASPHRANQAAKSALLESMKPSKGCHNIHMLRSVLRSPPKLQIVKTKLQSAEKKKRSKSDGKMEVSFVQLDIARRVFPFRNLERVPIRQLFPSPSSPISPRKAAQRPQFARTPAQEIASFVRIPPSKTAKQSPTRKDLPYDWSNVGPWGEEGLPEV